MTTSVIVTAVLETENKFKFVLSSDGVVIDHRLLTSASLKSSTGATLANSLADATLWDFTNADYLTVILGLAITTTGIHKCKLIAVDDLHPKGLAWFDTDLMLKILP